MGEDGGESNTKNKLSAGLWERMQAPFNEEQVKDL
jgi:hypothetical protein